MSRAGLFATASLAIAYLGLGAVPAEAQRTERIVTVFGTDPCPEGSGDEIVVCYRLDEDERYRIPKEFRENAPIAPENRSWASRVESMEYVGRTGLMSCSPNGPGGWTGCYQKMLRDAREERRQLEINPGYQPPE